MSIGEEMRQKLLAYRKNEITEHHIYRRLARIVGSPENRRILAKIADDELPTMACGESIPSRMWHLTD